MAGIKRTKARIEGDQQANASAVKAGRDVKASRKRRRLTQQVLATTVGISRGRLADVEAGRGTNAPMEVWFALGEALGRPFRAEFLRDRLDEPADAGLVWCDLRAVRLFARRGPGCRAGTA